MRIYESSLTVFKFGYKVGTRPDTIREWIDNNG